MEHNYIESLKFMRNEAIDEILSYANSDIQMYFEDKAQALTDEDVAEYFEKDEEIEEYGINYRFEREDVEDALSLLYHMEECFPDELMKAERDYQKYDNELSNAEYDIDRIEKKIKELLDVYGVTKYRIETSRKSISTYLYMPFEEGYEMVLNESDECDYYTDMDDEDLMELDEVCIRFSDHDTGTHWDWDFGDVSYNDDYAKIFI